MTYEDKGKELVMTQSLLSKSIEDFENSKSNLQEKITILNEKEDLLEKLKLKITSKKEK